MHRRCSPASPFHASSTRVSHLVLSNTHTLEPTQNVGFPASLHVLHTSKSIKTAERITGSAHSVVQSLPLKTLNGGYGDFGDGITLLVQPTIGQCTSTSCLVHMMLSCKGSSGCLRLEKLLTNIGCNPWLRFGSCLRLGLIGHVLIDGWPLLACFARDLLSSHDYKCPMIELLLP
jgi:hypothetical protein